MIDKFTWMRTALTVIEERGDDFVYVAPGEVDSGRACVYRYRNEPSCLFGEVLDRLGITNLIEGSGIGEVMHSRQIGDAAVQYASDRAQYSQDKGDPYRVVRAVFDAAYDGYREGMAHVEETP